MKYSEQINAILTTRFGKDSLITLTDGILFTDGLRYEIEFTEGATQ